MVSTIVQHPAAYARSPQSPPRSIPRGSSEQCGHLRHVRHGQETAGQVDDATVFTEPGSGPPAPKVTRPTVALPAAHSGSAQKPPRYKVSGYATFYGNGTTAMRLPRGTTIIVCGKGGCIERTVTDYGPVASSKNRVIDMYTPDFFSICGCPSFSGTTWVTVSFRTG